EMSFTGNFMDAHEALSLGLVNHVVAHSELMPFTRKIAKDIIGNEQDGVRQIRRTYASNNAQTDQWATEATDAKAWRKATFDPEIVAQRRARIMERGRTQ
ncbi:MAG: enoyl-CoA hydratase, partial [Actinomycetota bacterium]